MPTFRVHQHYGVDFYHDIQAPDEGTAKIISNWLIKINDGHGDALGGYDIQDVESLVEDKDKLLDFSAADLPEFDCQTYADLLKKIETEE